MAAVNAAAHAAGALTALGPVAQRRRDGARPRRRRLRPRGRLRLQISQWRARARRRSCSSPSSCRTSCARHSPAGWGTPSRSRSSPSTGRPRGSPRFLTGTPSILALAALEAGLDTFDGRGDERRRSQGAARCRDCFIAEVEARCGSEVTLASPRDPDSAAATSASPIRRAYAVMQALIDRGVDRRLPRARPDALRLRAALQPLRGRVARRRSARRHPRDARPGTNRASGPAKVT